LIGDRAFIGLISGGIDSPVAVNMMLEMGHFGHLLNMDAMPHAEEAEFEKVKRVVRRLSELHPGRLRFYTAPHGLFLTRFIERGDPRYTCLLCKRSMLRLADRLCSEWGAEFIVTGDSMGQVASQTLPNMAALSMGIEHPVIRPLVGLDKVEIEDIARDIGTYQISSPTTVGCTAAPRHPVIKVDPELLLKEEIEAGLDELFPRVKEGIREHKVR